jgi:hypothetical protein
MSRRTDYRPAPFERAVLQQVQRPERSPVRNRPRTTRPADRRVTLDLKQLVEEVRAESRIKFPGLVECQGEPGCSARVEPNQLCDSCRKSKQKTENASTNTTTATAVQES